MFDDEESSEDSSEGIDSIKGLCQVLSSQELMRIHLLDVDKGYDEDYPDDKLSFFRHLEKEM